MLSIVTEEGGSANEKCWSYIKSTRTEQTGASKLRRDGVLHLDSVSKVQIPNDHFSSVFTEDSTNIPIIDIGQ